MGQCAVCGLCCDVLLRREEPLRGCKEAEEQRVDQAPGLRSWSPHIHQLPDEMLEKIFSFLSQGDVLPHLLSVCQRWRAVAEDRILRKQLALTGAAVPTEVALHLVQAAPKLRSLELQGRVDAVALLQAASARCSKLLRLSVVWSHFRDPALTEPLCNVIRNCPHLTDVSLAGVWVDDGLKFCRELGIALPELRKLRICCRWFQSPELAALLGGCPRIQELRAPYCRCSPDNAVQLAQRWGGSLEALQLNAFQLGDASLAVLAGCSRLHHLKLTYFAGPGAGLHHLCVLSQLEEFDLSYTREVQAEGWRGLFGHSHSSHRLRKLALRGCHNVDDRVLSELAAVCPRLEHLVLPRTSVSGAGVREVLQSCRKLRRLDVMHADVTDVVPELPQLAPQLYWIGIGREAKSSLGEDTLKCIEAQMPHLKVD